MTASLLGSLWSKSPSTPTPTHRSSSFTSSSSRSRHCPTGSFPSLFTDGFLQQDVSLAPEASENVSLKNHTVNIGSSFAMKSHVTTGDLLQHSLHACDVSAHRCLGVFDTYLNMVLCVFQSKIRRCVRETEGPVSSLSCLLGYFHRVIY